ncbi:MAG: DNA helicase PcrA [Firmicutes bacterium]|nr:DNA helicase PcrA [Bacillota bacterium]
MTAQVGKSDEVNELLRGLNPQQQKAVQVVDGPLLIVAGAGSGKTSVLTRRIAYLMAKEGAAPWSILAITFTNKAARELRERVERLVGVGASDIWVSTFHSMCARILRKECEKVGYQSSFTILDAADQLSALRRVCTELNLDSKRYEPRGLLGAISQHKNALIGPEAASRAAKNPYEQVVARAYVRYQAMLKGQNSMDFDDLIMQTVELLKADATTLQYYQMRFRYILVDEYQDTNHSQYQLVQLLAARTRNLCVVGDSDQSIYGWRGADIANILSFERDYPEANVIALEQNYRSTQRILQVANAVIEKNRARPRKTLWTENPEGASVRLVRTLDEREEGRFIVDEVYRRKQLGELEFGDCAVLYRTNAQSRVIEEACLKAGLPYRVFGGIKFYDRKEVKDMLAYLRLVANPDDDIAFLRVVNVPRRGIGDGTIGRLQEFAQEHSLPLLAALNQVDLLGLAPRFLSPLEDFGLSIRQFSAQQEYLTIAELIEQIMDRTGYRQMLVADQSIEGQARLENVEELLTVAKEFEQRSPGAGLVGFLTDVALVADADQEGGTGDGLTLMTLHSAKGLEFPVVFLVGLEEGLFPHLRALTDPSEMEEERRLCYVGITRAQRELYLSCAFQRTIFGMTRTNPPSRFVAEVPPDLLSEVRFGQASEGRDGSFRGRFGQVRVAGGEPWRTQSGVAGGSGGPVGGGGGGGGGGGATRTVASGSTVGGSGITHMPSGFGGDLTADWAKGDRVSHRKWGQGIVTGMSGTGDDLELIIDFPAPIGSKKLLVKYAPITRES